MGMAFQSIANSGQPPYFDTLINEGVVTDPSFSFFLGRASSGTQGQSEMTLGGNDPSKYTGAITNVPLISEDYWRVAVDGANVTNPSGLLGTGLLSGSSGILPGTMGQAAIDTGTTIILAPTVAAAAIFSQIPG